MWSNFLANKTGRMYAFIAKLFLPININFFDHTFTFHAFLQISQLGCSDRDGVLKGNFGVVSVSRSDEAGNVSYRFGEILQSRMNTRI